MTRLGSLALAGLLGMLGLTLTAPTAGAESRPNAAAVFSSCLAQEQKGDLLVLMDESLSLGPNGGSNDLANDRVTAAKDLIAQLEQVTRSTKISIDVAVAGFAAVYDQALPWTPLRKETKASIDMVLGSFGNRNKGVQTDYWMGLNGAREAVAERPNDRCQAIAWFSDGVFDVRLDPGQWDDHPEARKKPYADGLDLRNPADAAKAQTAALESICKRGGMADQLRKRRVTVFAVGLDRGKSQDFGPMSQIATGQAVGGATCGTRTEPTPGMFTRARDISDLIFAFRSLTNPAPDRNLKLCPATNLEQCRRFGQTFVLDGSLTRVDIDAKVSEGSVTGYVRNPGGEWSPLKPGAAGAVASGTYSWPKGSNVLGIDLALDVALKKRQPWTGPWTLVFVKKNSRGTATVKIDVRGNLYPAWPGASSTGLYVGERPALKFELRNNKGRMSSAALLGSGNLTALLTDAKGSRLGAATIPVRNVDRTPFVPDLSEAEAGRGVLTLQLDVTTAPSGGVPGTALTPRVQRIQVEIRPRKDTGGAESSTIDFGAITDRADVERSLKVVGPVCIWRDPGQPLQVDTGGDSAGETTISSSASSAATCVKVDKGATGELPLRLTTSKAGNDDLSGWVPVVASSREDAGQQTTIQVQFTASLQKPFNFTNAAVVLIATLLLGIGLPWAILAVAKFLTAKIPGRALMFESIPVTVRNGEVFRDQAPLGLRDSDFTAMVPLNNSGNRRTQAAGLTFSTHTGFSPFGAGYVVAKGADGSRALSSSHPTPQPKTGAARLPLAVHNHWVAVKEAQGPGDLRLVILADLDSGADGRQRLVDDARRRLPELIGRLEVGQQQPQLADVFDAVGTTSSVDPASPFTAAFDQPWSGFPPTAPPSGGHPPPSGQPAPPGPASRPAGGTPPGTPTAQPPRGEGDTFSFDFDDDPNKR